MDVQLLTNVALGLLAMSGAWIGAYVAVRADLARLHERVVNIMARVDDVHKRIDDLVQYKGLDRRA